jgi:FKBP-type peptidyl-prolyl cis-trans isomerase FklB
MTVFIYTGMSLAADSLDLTDEKIKLSYSAGYQVGGDFKRQKTEINPAMLLKGVEDALAGKKPLMSAQEMRTTLVELQKQILALQDQQMTEQAVKNLEEGKVFLLENGKKEGITTLPSGLQYKIIKEGSGKTPAENDSVTVHYKGWLINGFEFDSSYRRNKPAAFPVSGVIAGWTEALQLMKEGAHWQLFIPPGLAYGERGTGRIGPNSTLIFDVELISVQSANSEEVK